MTCAKHPGRTVAVCGEPVCAGCYHDALMADPPPPLRQAPARREIKGKHTAWGWKP